MDMKQKLEVECARREELEKELQALSLQHRAEKEEVVFYILSFVVCY